MLAKKFKLPLEAFHAQKGKRRTEMPLFSVFMIPNGFTYNRIGVTLSAKMEKKAVRRHALGRIIYQAARGWPARSLDINIVGRTPLTKATSQEIKTELEQFASLNLKP